MVSDLHEASIEGVAPDRSFAALGSMLSRYRGRVVAASVVRSIASALPALHPFFLAQLATSADEPDQAARYLVLLFATGFAHFILWSGCDYYVAAKLNPLTYEFKRIAFNTVWSADYQRFVDRPSGKVASYVNDIRNHVQFLWDALHYGFLPMLAAIPVYVLLLWQTAPGNALAYGLFLVGAGLILSLVIGPVNERQRRLTDTTATNTGRVFDSYANFVNVFSFRAQRKEIARNDEQLDGLIGNDVRFGFALSSYWAVASALIRGLLWAIIMAYSWWQFDRGNISFTAMIVSVTVLLDFTSRYWEVVYNFGVWIDKSAAYREAYNYLFPGRNIVADPVPDPSGSSARTGDGGGHGDGGGDGDATPVRLQHELEIRDLSFAYPDEPDRLVLDRISFRVAKGERIGIVGRSGEGKSTLIKILLGFYAPTSGQVLIDGQPVEPGDLNQLQAYVPQDTSLFQETIEYNIGYAATDEMTIDEVAEAAGQASIADFIETLPQGYQTLVGERGIKLSLGQRQRIAIARAFVTDASLVILDEATSALDSETEARIQDALEGLWDGRAAIVIAHRLATLNHVDRILVIEHGRVVEEGTKDDLLASAGRFADLWDLQQAGLLP